jgi:hypothetical protein
LFSSHAYLPHLCVFPNELRMVASTTINKGSNALTADDNSSNNRLKKRSTFATRELIDRAIVERISLTRIEGGVQHRFLNNNCFLEVNEKYAKVARSVQVTPKKRGGVSVSMRYGAVLRPLSDSKTSYRRAIQQYIEATGVSASPKNLVLFKIVGESHWCHLVFHSSLQCIITCVALPILCGGF